MLKYVTILATVIYAVSSQRPPYAGTSNRYPVVLPQYLEGHSTVAPAAAGTIGNRIDVDGNSVNAVNGTTSTTILEELPVDALGDRELVERIKTWPKEKQPFWFLNWQQIQEHRGDANNPAKPVQTQPNTRSFFSG